MTKVISAHLIFLFTFLFVSCTSENDNQEILGQWQGISWKVQDQESGRDASQVNFTFNADDTYSASFGQQAEEGTFRLTADKLYTTAQGQAEKMVKITLTGSDTIVMDMNRVGTLEELILVKK